MLRRGANDTASSVLLIAVSFAAIAAIFGLSRRSLAESPAPSAASTPMSASGPGANNPAVAALATSQSANPTSGAAVSPANPQSVIAYLADVIGWYRHLGIESQLVVEPNEMLFFSNDRQIANQILSSAFKYAR